MTRIQQSIEIGVPAHIVYSRLTQFEDYPRFMQDVESVHQLDDTHLHWTTKMSNRDVEWDATITERVPDSCIAWHNTSGPTNAGKVEVQAVGPGASCVVLTLEADPEQVPGSSAGNGEAEMSQRLEQDLARLKEFIEARGRDAAARADANRNASGEAAGAQRSGFAAGSEGWDGTEDPAQPALAAARNAARAADGAMHSAAATESEAAAHRTTQSDYSLSQSSADEAEDGRFSVAEEISLDQQSDAARRVGQMPEDVAAASNPSDADAQSMRRNGQDTKDDEKLKQSIERAVPPSE